MPKRTTSNQIKTKVASRLWRVAGYQIRYQKVPSPHFMPAFSGNAIESLLGLRSYYLSE